MKKPDVESILLVDRYLICRLCDNNKKHISLTRRYLARKINKALQRRSQSKVFSLFSFLTF